MKALFILVAMLAGTAQAADANQCHPQTVIVCPLKKPVKKAVVKKPVVVKKAKQVITFEPTYITGNVTKTKKVAPVAKPVVKKVIERDPDLIVAGIAELGLSPRAPNTEGLLGLRLHYKPWRLGVQAHTNFAYGWGVQALVYPYQGERLSWQFNLGAQFVGSKFLSTQDVPRTWDLTVGTGIEYKVWKHLSLTADYRMNLPSPVFMADHEQAVYGADGRKLDIGHVFGNALTQGHFLIGIMLHN